VRPNDEKDFDYQGARDFDRERVRKDAEAAFRREEHVYSHEEVRGREGRRGDGHLDERPLPELLRDMAAEGKRLLRAEMHLVRSELKHEAKKAGAGAGMLTAGGVAGLLGAMALTACLVVALSALMPLWLSALLVGAAMLVVAGILAASGLKAIKSVKPDRTIHSLKEDSQWASETLRAAKQQTHGHA
jgi:hypothetical protein